MALPTANSDSRLHTPTLDSESSTLLHTVSEHGGYVYVSMAARAAAGDVRAAEAAREMAWEQLHSGPWHSVLPVWRDAYAMACLHVAKLHFAAGEFTDALKALDMGLLMGGPLFKSDLHSAVNKVSAKARDARVPVPEERCPNSDRRLVRDDFKATEMLGVLPPKSLSCKMVVKRSGLSLEGFLTEYFLPGSPVILTDCMAHWPARTKWNDMDYLIRVAGDRTVPVEVGKNYLYPEWKQELITFSQFLERIRANDSSSGAPTYLAQHSLFDQINELRDDICIPDYCCAGGGELRSLNAWFGPAGTVTPLHHDPHHNVFAQVVGKKYVRLYRASLSEELYPYTETMLCNSSQVDLDNVDEKEFPEVQDLEFLDCILEEETPQNKAKPLAQLRMATAAINLTLVKPSAFYVRKSQNPSISRVFTLRCSSATANAVPDLAERPWKTSDARLVLEDGSIWRAKSFGASGTQVGEVVFNTSLTGYQEILTDPSYAGQFVLMTNPHIGNTGVNFDDEESRQCFLGGLVIRSLSISTSNHRCAETLGDYLAERNIMGIYDVDTRAITRRLRQDGSLIGVLSTEETKTDEELLEMSRSWDIVGVDLISGVSCKTPHEWVDKTSSEWEFKNSKDGEAFRVVAYDFGIKHNILRRLASYGCKITVVPSTWPASETLKMKPDGVLFSNGPGDPSAVPYAVKTVKEILGKVPVFGICMGHQLLGLALGGTTFKMKFGHHGGNHPVRNLRTGHVEISAQNHNYAVDPTSLPDGVEVTHVNLNDGSCAGLAYPARNIMSIQYHPEASPGPHDSDYAFREFIELMKRVKVNA